MLEYDAAFKLLLRDVDVAIREIAGTTVTAWLSSDLPALRNLRLDMLGQAADGSLLHIELQSTNDTLMDVRMLEYGIGAYRRYKKFPNQIVLYAGEEAMRMPAEVKGPLISYRYRLVDVRDLDREKLFNSAKVGDNILGVLTSPPDVRYAIRHVVDRIATLDAAGRDQSLRQLMVLAGLRKVAGVVEEEAKKVPILNSILDHEVLGREYKRGWQEGEQEGEQRGVERGIRKGIEIGAHQAGTALLRQFLAKRFGGIPAWVDQRIEALSPAQINTIADRVLDARSLDELFE